MIQEISTPDSDSVPGVLSQAVDTGSLIFVWGQINITATGDMIGDTVQEKLEQIMKNIATILGAAERMASKSLSALSVKRLYCMTRL